MAFTIEAVWPCPLLAQSGHFNSADALATPLLRALVMPKQCQQKNYWERNAQYPKQCTFPKAHDNLHRSSGLFC